MRRLALRTVIGAVAMLVTLVAAPGFGLVSTTDAHAVTKISHANATAMFRAAGITWSTGAHCADRPEAGCASFEQLNLKTARGAITMRNVSSCALDIISGTERNEPSRPHGTYSHANGYQLDYRRSACLDQYITSRFASVGGHDWQSGSGNVYHRASDHWDVTYYNCGGC